MSFLSRLMGAASGGMSPAEFVSDRDADAPLLDVRTPGEFAGGHLAGATNVDVTARDFRERIEAMGLPASGPVYCYCQSGGRSGQAVGQLKKMGIEGAVNVGGIGPLAKAGAEVA